LLETLVVTVIPDMVTLLFIENQANVDVPNNTVDIKSITMADTIFLIPNFISNKPLFQNILKIKKSCIQLAPY
jgi:hypothetical protein